AAEDTATVANSVPDILFAEIEHIGGDGDHTAPHDGAFVRRAVALAGSLRDTRAPDTLTTPSKSALRRGQSRDIPVGVVRISDGTQTNDVQVYEVETGAMRPESLTEFAVLMGLDDPTLVSPRLLAILYILVRDYDRPIRLVSGHREPPDGFAAGHESGQAVDFFIDGVSTDALRAHCAARFGQIGLGYRPHAGLL